MAGNYEMLEVIGSGTFGRAWLVKSKQNHRKYVIKEIKVSGMSAKDREQALTEITVLARCKHVNIIRYREAFLENGMLNIAMEYAERGDLNKKIQDQKGQYFTEQIILDWFVQICFGLRYIHSKNIIHRDLKTHNIFLSGNNVVKIGDFGISRVLADSLDHACTAIGTPYYLSPEICQRQPYNCKSDMWAVGCVLYEMCSLRYAFQGDNFTSLVLRIMEGRYDPIPSHYCPLLQDLVGVLLRLKAEGRPSAEQLLIVPSIQPHVQSYIRRQNKHKELRSNSASPHISRRKISEDKENIAPKGCATVAKPRKFSVVTPKTDLVFQQCITRSCDAMQQKKELNMQKVPKFNLQKAIAERRQMKATSVPCDDVDLESFQPASIPTLLTEVGHGRDGTECAAVAVRRKDSEVEDSAGRECQVTRGIVKAIKSYTYKVSTSCEESPKVELDAGSTKPQGGETGGIANIVELMVSTFPGGSGQIYSQMEAMRDLLERELGVDCVLRVHRALQQTVEGASQLGMSDLCKLITPDKTYYLPLVVQLLTMEVFAYQLI